MKTEIINGKLYYPVDMGDDEGIVYMTKEDIDMLNGVSSDKPRTLPQHYVVEGRYDYMDRLKEYAEMGCRDVVNLTQEEFEEMYENTYGEKWTE